MGRLDQKFQLRGKSFSHRVVDVAEAVEARRRSHRIVDQMIGCGTSVGANLYEANDAVSRKDFSKSLGTVLKELGESRFWLEFVSERAGWRRSDLSRSCLNARNSGKCSERWWRASRRTIAPLTDSWSLLLCCSAVLLLYETMPGLGVNQDRAEGQRVREPHVRAGCSLHEGAAHGADREAVPCANLPDLRRRAR